jgi:hypothetical protein
MKSDTFPFSSQHVKFTPVCLCRWLRSLPLDQALHPAGIYVARMHGQGLAHLGDIDPFVAEEFELTDVASGEQWRGGEQHP